MGEVGGYVLDLYCDRQPCVRTDHTSQFFRTGGLRDQFVEPNGRAAKREARRSGWVFKAGKWTCPGCVQTWGRS